MKTRLHPFFIYIGCRDTKSEEKSKIVQEQYKIIQDKYKTVDTEFRPVPRTHEQAGRVRSMELEIYLASAQGWSILRTLSRRASQFDPAIDKERKLISN